MTRLPLENRLLLKPWFLAKAMTQAEELLQKYSAPLVIVYRQAAVGIWADGQGWCRLKFEEAPAIRQGFRLVAAACSRCSLRRQNGDLCAHLAVLASQVLVVGTRGVMPAPLAYGLSPWASVAKFLEQHGANAVISLSANGWLALCSEAFFLEAQVADTDLALARHLFPDRHWPGMGELDAMSAKMIQDAWGSLQATSRTETEVLLNNRGQQSQGQRLARSLWAFLCQAFFRSAPAPVWRLQRQGNGKIILSADSVDGHSVVRFTPNQDLIVDLLQQAGLLDLIEVQAKARAYSKIYFSLESGDLIVEPWLELVDGSRYRRDTLVDYRYGRYYSVAGLIFFAVHEQESNFDEEADDALPLFACVNTRQYQSRSISAADIPDFMKRYQQAMLAGGHDVDPLLVDFTVVDLPDSLEIKDYQEDGEWCMLDASYRFGANSVELVEVLRLHRLGAKHIAGRTSWLQVDNTPLGWLHSLPLERHGGRTSETKLRLTRREMMALTSLVPEVRYPAKESVKKTLRERLASGAVVDLLEAEMPAHLRQYQRQGLAWLYHLHGNGVGGVLADDMGLGKTHQALALLSLLAKLGKFCALVVCPASVLPHWQDKLVTFYPDLAWKVYYGPARREIELDDAVVILTTYGVLRQDIGKIREMDCQVVVFDEIQQLKNKQTVTYQAAEQMGGLTYGLTGTPIENSLSDLKAIYDLCLPGLLGSDATFQKIYQNPIEDGANHSRIDSLKRILAPFMLRRLKDQVLTELPEVIEDVRFCSLSEDQVALYRQVIDSEGIGLLSSLADTTVGPIPYMKFLAVVQELKQICNHPCQVLKNTNYQKYGSGKWDLFVEILSECLDAGLKVVVFSQYTKMLNILEAYLGEQGICYAGIRGTMTPSVRQKMILRFNEDDDIKVFCASLLAGGTGIDLTAAQVVIHYDRWWNSAREEQATARVHRFGQRQAVQVFKFITKGTLEEKIHRLINRKKDLAADIVQTDDDSFVKRLSREDLAELLQWS